jgi:hypothetical protein
MRWLLFFREFVLFTAFIQLCSRYQIERPPELHMQPAKRGFVGSIPKISTGIERLLHAEHVIVAQMPLLLDLRNLLTAPYRNNQCIIIEFVTIELEEVKKELPQCLFIFLAESA